MRSSHDCAPAGQTAEARGLTKTPVATRVPHPVAEAQAGKQFAMWLHNYVIDDVDVTQATFARHPEWVAA